MSKKRGFFHSRHIKDYHPPDLQVGRLFGGQALETSADSRLEWVWWSNCKPPVDTTAYHREPGSSGTCFIQHLLMEQKAPAVGVQVPSALPVRLSHGQRHLLLTGWFHPAHHRGKLPSSFSYSLCFCPLHFSINLSFSFLLCFSLTPHPLHSPSHPLKSFLTMDINSTYWPWFLWFYCIS